MGAPKRQRLDEIVRRFVAGGPYRSGAEARLSLERAMREVENLLSGVPENPNAANSPPDGRMYPPHDKFERRSGSAEVRLWKQTAHRTWIANNGAVRIERGDGVVEVDLQGDDGRSVADLLEMKDERDRKTQGLR